MCRVGIQHDRIFQLKYPHENVKWMGFMLQAVRFLHRLVFSRFRRWGMLLTIPFPPEENDPDWMEVWELSGEAWVPSGKLR